MKEEKGLPPIAVIGTIVSCLCISFLFGLDIYITRINDGDNFNEAFNAASIVFVIAFMFPCSFTLFILMLMKADMDRKEREQK
jgi:lipoprotein